MESSDSRPAEGAGAESSDLQPAEDVGAESAEVQSTGGDASDPGGMTDSQGRLGVEGRAFPGDEVATTDDQSVTALAQLEVTHEHGIFKARVGGYARVDARDRNRDTLELQEAWAQLWWGPLRVRGGFDILNWSATEAFHPADVINARDLESDLENFQKRGELMLLVSLQLPSDTTISVFALPLFTTPLLPSRRSRLNPLPLGVRLAPEIKIGRDGRRTTSDFGAQGGLQVRQVLGSADIAIHALEHLDRSQPLLLIDGENGTVQPVFLTVRQLGGTYQQVFGSWIAKVESAARRFVAVQDETLPIEGWNHISVAAGLEYGWAHENGAESAVIVEAQSLFRSNRSERQALNVFQRDVLVGYRLGWNDEASQQLIFTGIFDLERRREFLLTLGYQRRLGEQWGLDATLRVIDSHEPAGDLTGLAALRSDDQLRLSLTRYF